MAQNGRTGRSPSYLLFFSLTLSLFVGLTRSQHAEFENQEIDVMKTKCEVCKTAVKILFKEVEATDPAKVVEIGSFRLQADGTTLQKKVPYRGSEVQLHDLFDEGKICSSMKDYVPVTDKETGLPTMINMAEDMDMLSRVKFNPNPDFNSRMNTLCEEIVGDHDESLMELFKTKVTPDGLKASPAEFGREFCVETTNLCDLDDNMDRLKPASPAKQKAPTRQPANADEQEEISDFGNWDNELGGNHGDEYDGVDPQDDDPVENSLHTEL